MSAAQDAELSGQSGKSGWEVITLNNYCTQVARSIPLTTTIESSVKSKYSETPYGRIFVHS